MKRLFTFGCLLISLGVNAQADSTSKWSLAADGHSGWQRRYENGTSLETREWWNVSAGILFRLMAYGCCGTKRMPIMIAG